jgi:hypothetical protein
MRKLTALISLVGTLFSGYLTASYFINQSCSLGCSFLFGYPTCMYGFVLFALLLLFSLIDHEQSRPILLTISIMGVLFSLWFAIKELGVCIACYPLGLPNCVYGLVLYAIVVWLAWREGRNV